MGELCRRLGGSACGQQVVDNEHALAFLDRVPVDLQRIGAIFQGIVKLGGGGRQLAGLAQGDEARIQTIGDCGAEYKASRFHAQHQVDTGSQVVFGQRHNQSGGAELVLEQSGDVVEQDALLGEIRNFADQLFQRLA